MRKKSDRFLKLIIGFKAGIGIFEIALSISLFKHFGKTVEETFTALAVSMNLDTDHKFIGSLIGKAGVLDNGVFIGLTAGGFVFGIMNTKKVGGVSFRW